MKLLINGLAVWITAWLLPGVMVENFLTSVIVAVVLAVINTFLKPILIVLTLPVTIMTLGIFLLVLNALMIMLAGSLVPGFVVGSWRSALWFSLVLWMVNTVLEMMTGDKKSV